MSSVNAITLRHAGPVLHVTLDQPQTRNAMSLAMVRELRDALVAAEYDAATRVVVLRGAGGHFCSGGSVADMAAARARLASEPDAIASLSAAFGELCLAYARTPLAVVAVLEGAVLGGGFGLACVADVALAGESAVFRLPETSLGLVPAQIAPFLVERLGYAEAKRLAVTGCRLGARDALALRLVHEVHADDALDGALARVVDGILQCAPAALASTKALLVQARFTPVADELIRDAAARFSAAVVGAEGREGTAAFLSKRQPNWAPSPPAKRSEEQ